MKAELRAAHILQKWINECYAKRGCIDFLADGASLQQAIALGIIEAEGDVLDWHAQELKKLSEGMTFDRYAADGMEPKERDATLYPTEEPGLAWNGHEYIGRNA